jgi:hypothetical protein
MVSENDEVFGLSLRPWCVKIYELIVRMAWVYGSMDTA